MPCNTAHAHASLIQRASGLPLIDLIEAGAAAAAATGARRAGVIGTKGALRLYREYLAAHAMGLVALSPEGDATFMELLYRIKGGDTGPEVRAGMKALAEALVADGAEAVIAGCTEAPLVLGRQDLKVEFIDPADQLARRCVAVCLGLEPAPALPA
jgi:aspartate racemase